LSRRQQFRSITPPFALLQYIKQIGVGIPPRRSQQDSSRPIYSNARKEKKRREESKGKQTVTNLRVDRGHNIHKYDPAGKILFAPPPKDQVKSGAFVEPPPHPFDRDAVVRLRHTVATDTPNFPKPNEDFPEIALIGRSNVGKSTLVNAILHGNRNSRTNEEGYSFLDEAVRHNVRGKVPAKVKMPRGVKAPMSDKPGETTDLNFFRIKSRQTNTGLTIVDMPGYGFSFKGSTVDENAYADLAVRFVTDAAHKTLKRLMLLVDARHGFKKSDFEFLKGLEDKVKEGKANGESLRIPPIQVVLTKSDLVEQADLARRIVITKEQLRDALEREYGDLRIMCVSAKSGVGYNNVGWTKTGAFVARGGVLELQKELASIATKTKKRV
jgi:GTP-binding protein